MLFHKAIEIKKYRKKGIYPDVRDIHEKINFIDFMSYAVRKIIYKDRQDEQDFKSNLGLTFFILSILSILVKTVFCHSTA